MSLTLPPATLRNVELHKPVISLKKRNTPIFSLYEYDVKVWLSPTDIWSKCYRESEDEEKNI